MRPSSSALVQIPTSLLDETQGWVAMQVRMGWGNAAESQGGAGWPEVFRWRDDSNNLIEGYYDEGGNRFYFDRRGPGLVQVSKAFTFAASDLVTLIFAWTATSVSRRVRVRKSRC